MDIEKLWQEFAAASIVTKDRAALERYRRVFLGGMVVGLTQAAAALADAGEDIQARGLTVIGELSVSKDRCASDEPQTADVWELEDGELVMVAAVYDGVVRFAATKCGVMQRLLVGEWSPNAKLVWRQKK